jgi:CRP-like cAMP-binding protein
VLKKATENIQFFQKLCQEEKDDETLNLCLKNMTLETFDQYSVVFEKGMPANKFYIVIEG